MGKNRNKANGEGTIYKTENGYRGQITIGLDDNGKLIRRSFRGKTKKEVSKKINDYFASLHHGTYIDSNNITFGEWLEYFLETYKKNQVSPKHYDTTEYHINKHLIPSLGNIKLQDLTTDAIQEMYNEKYISGRLDGKGGLSSRTIKHLHETVRMSLSKAVSNKMIPFNPSLNCEIKYPETNAKKKHFTIEEQNRILEVIDGDNRSELIALTCIITGLRMGEVIALTWEDIDFNKLMISINKAITIYKNRDDLGDKNYLKAIKDPKTKHSKRSVPITKELAVLLKKHKNKMNEENLALGRSSKEFNIVFQTKNGTHHNQSNVTRTWNRILERADVEHVGFHGIRHSYTTRLMELNLNPKIVQEFLGHSTLSTTLNIYSHLTKDMIDSSRDTIADVFKMGIKNIKDDDSVEETALDYLVV